jgi:hypothetical protein
VCVCERLFAPCLSMPVVPELVLRYGLTPPGGHLGLADGGPFYYKNKYVFLPAGVWGLRRAALPSQARLVLARRKNKRLGGGVRSRVTAVR